LSEELQLDWFERLTGFQEGGYEETRRRLEVDGRRLRSRVNGQAYGIGELELVSLQTLRDRVQGTGGLPGRLKVRIVTGDVRAMHQAPENAGALFQVASQFNLLEMVSEDVTPEDGVTRYQSDRTQGPACAIAAGAATIWRNYFVPVGSGIGQTRHRQLDGLADVGAALSDALDLPLEALWEMRNGYALCTRPGLDAISAHLDASSREEVDALRAKLRIGVHWDVEVTDSRQAQRPTVSQAFCSALPIISSAMRDGNWRALASLVLEGAYEATMWAAVHNAQRGASNIVLLTRLGGGAFGNDDEWIHAAMIRALRMTQEFDLEVRLVSYGSPTHALRDMAAEFA
jgi:hypothetical protein